MTTPRPRPVDIGRTGLGLLGLLRPDDLLRMTQIHDLSRGTQRAARILGGRYLGQAAVGLLFRRPWTSRADATIEAIHATSMIAFATWSPRHRRAALTSALVAAGFTLLDLTEGYR